VISIKPLTSDVILAINRLVKYMSWEKFAFAKSQLGKHYITSVLLQYSAPQMCKEQTILLHFNENSSVL